MTEALGPVDQQLQLQLAIDKGIADIYPEGRQPTPEVKKIIEGAVALVYEQSTRRDLKALLPKRTPLHDIWRASFDRIRTTNRTWEEKLKPMVAGWLVVADLPYGHGSSLPMACAQRVMTNLLADKKAVARRPG